MKITAVVTAHREGLYAGPSVASVKEAIHHAYAKGLSVEPIIVFDRPDELTRTVIEQGDIRAQYLFTDYGDPARARMRGVAEGTGDFVTFLDADDLWGFNWIADAFEFVSKEGARTIGHSELNVVFGGQSLLWLHPDSMAKDFDFKYLRISNYWDALCFASREVFERYPMKENNLAVGYGHEDWHWNCLTYSAGYQHRPVPNTVHMKRTRPDSQSARCNALGVVPWPTPLERHSWTPEK